MKYAVLDLESGCSPVWSQAKVWDINRCKLIQTLAGHTAAIFAVDLNEDGQLVVTGSADKVDTGVIITNTLRYAVKGFHPTPY